MENFDAEQPMEDLQEQTPKKEPKNPLYDCYSLLHDLVYILAAITIVFVFFVRLVGVDGPSMMPTLQDGDYVALLSNLFMGDLEQGDVIVARKESFENGEPIVKRVIATEGQTVDIDFANGIVYVDGEDENLGDAAFGKADMVKKNDETIGRTGNGVLTQVFLDTQDDEITVAIINTYLAKAAEDYDEKNDDVDLDVYYVDNNGTSRKPVYMKTADEDKPQKQTISVDGEDFAIEEVAENDLFLVTIAQGVIQTMDAPEVLSDTSISNFRLEKYVTAGGTQYDYADTVMYDEEVLDQYDDANMKDVTYNVILDVPSYFFFNTYFHF